MIKESRLEMRVNKEIKKLLMIASQLSNVTLTDFIIDASYKEAVRIKTEHQRLDLFTNLNDNLMKDLKGK